MFARYFMKAKIAAIKEKLKPVLDFSAGMNERRLTVYASSGCYYLFMSLVPIIMVLCCLLKYTPFTQSMVTGYVNQFFPDSAAEIINTIVSSIYSSGWAAMTISIVLTLYSASASMKALMKGVDAANGFTNKDNFIKTSIRAVLYMLILIAALLLSLVVLVYGGRILKLIQKRLPDFTGLNLILSSLRYLLLIIPLALLFAVLFTLMPSEKVRFKDQIPGAVLTAFVWVIFSSVFNLYVNISNKYGAYGYIGTLMAAMMWMFYCLYFLLIGAYFNSFRIAGISSPST